MWVPDTLRATEYGKGSRPRVPASFESALAGSCPKPSCSLPAVELKDARQPSGRKEEQGRRLGADLPTRPGSSEAPPRRPPAGGRGIAGAPAPPPPRAPRARALVSLRARPRRPEAWGGAAAGLALASRLPLWPPQPPRAVSECCEARGRVTRAPVGATGPAEEEVRSGAQRSLRERAGPSAPPRPCPGGAARAAARKEVSAPRRRPRLRPGASNPRCRRARGRAEPRSLRCPPRGAWLAALGLLRRRPGSLQGRSERPSGPFLGFPELSYRRGGAPCFTRDLLSLWH
ncbi:uncharacterized protein LOC144337599 [Macaca mulatta]